MSDRKPSQTFDLLTKEAEPDTTSANPQGQVHAEAAIHPLHQLQRMAGNRFTQQRLSRQADGNGDIQPGSAIQTALDSVGGGQPLPNMTRVGMGMALGADLSGVRIHRGPVAAAAASELGARAFTVGRDIFFGAGEYDPTSPAGRDLLAHELAHTLQSGAGGDLDLTQLDAQPPDPQITESEPVERVQAEPVSLEAPPEEVDVAPSEPMPEEERPPEGEEGPAPAAGAERRAQVQVHIQEVPPAPEDTRPDIELLMPTPPAGLTANSRGRLTTSQQTMGDAVTEVETLPTSTESTHAAREAVEEPEAETQGRAEGRLAEALGVRPEPSPEIVELCENIRESIRERRPVDEDELVEADPEDMAQQAGTELNASVEGDTERIEGSYAEMNEPQEGTPELTPQPIDVPPTEVATPDPNAAAAAPDAVDPATTDLSADQERMDAEMEAAGMNSETAQAIRDPSHPVVQARAARGELEETAQSRPGEVMAAQDAALQEASANMASMQEQALAALSESRSSTVSDVSGQQTEMVGTESQIREQLSNRARQIFTDAQDKVNALLQPLTDNAMEKWRAGVARLSTDFRESLNRVKAWIDERHSGVGGRIVAGWDALTGLPGWVTREYDRAEKQFGDDVCDLIMEISAEVNLVIAACEALIDDARQDIDDLYTQEMPEGLREWAEAERLRMQGQLDGLQNQVTSTQQNFNRNLSREAVRAVREVQDEVATLREEAKGLIGRIADAIGDFLDDPIRAIINGLLSLVGIQPSAFWSLVNKVQQVIADIADDPKRFINNLVSAVGRGFQSFFDNILKHLLAGFVDWLFGGLPSVGVEIPTDLSLKSVITFFLQLMGITWPRIREILVRHIGEKNVALIETAWSIIATLIDKGPQGIFEWIKQMLDPESILRQIIDAAIKFVVEALIKNVTARVVMLLNPVGAIAQAIELIYRVLRWIFTNAARIFSFVETVVNGMADIIAGNIGGMAKAVEAALAKLIPPVIDFLAGLIGLGDLPNKVVETVKGMQEWVASILDRAIGWLVEQGRRLLEAVGLGGEQEPTATGELGPVGDTINFTGGDASHRMWIEESGTATTVMVASGEESVGQKLARWKTEAPRLGEQRGEAENLIGQAVSQLGTTDKEAYEAAVAKHQAEAQVSAGAADGGQASGASTAVETFEQENQEVKEKQQGLSQILAQLFDLFGEQRDLAIIYAQELALIHTVAQPTIHADLEALSDRASEFEKWSDVQQALKQSELTRRMLAKPLNKDNPFGNDFAHDWAVQAVYRAIAITKQEMKTADESTEAKVHSVMLRLANHGQVPSTAAADWYLVNHKTQLHAPSSPFDVTPTPVAKTEETIWRATMRNSASARINQAFQDRIRMGQGRPPGPQLPSTIRERIWRLLGEASLSIRGTEEIYVEVDSNTDKKITEYLGKQAESYRDAGDTTMQSALTWWQDNILAPEFHHAWPQWLGGPAEQTRIYLPRALHNFRGITTEKEGFPGGFHQAFNAKFRVAFPELAVEDKDDWQAYVSGNPLALDRVHKLLIDSYQQVLGKIAGQGAEAATTFINEAKKTYDALIPK